MKILIVDDHGVVREGLQGCSSPISRLRSSNSGNIDDWSHSLYARKAGHRRSRPQSRRCGRARAASPRVSADNAARVIVFSMHHEPIYAVRALRSGARGYVSKSAPVVRADRCDPRGARRRAVHRPRPRLAHRSKPDIDGRSAAVAIDPRGRDFAHARTGQKHDVDLGKPRHRLQNRRPTSARR